VPNGFSSGYVNNTPNTPSSLSSGFTVATDASSLAARTENPQTLLLNKALNSSDSATLLNQLDQSGQIGISPVYGQRTSDNGTGTFSSGLLTLPDRASFDDIATMRMRQELQDTQNPNGVQPVQPAPDGTQPPPAPGLNDPLNKPLGQGFDAAGSTAISDRVVASQLPSNQLSSTGIIAANAGQLPSMIPPAEQQSTLLATLQTRLRDSGEVGAALAGNPAAHVAPPRSAANPAAKPAGTDSKIPAPSPDQGPVPVSSLADGIKAKGLRDLLSGSEDLIRQGKFDSAIARYDQAQRVAPNNPLPALGRAHAELAGGYYAKAELDLRSVFTKDPELMLMRFDLGSLFPKERIAYVSKDLHDLAKGDAAAERPWFLLAYLDYNTGNSTAAETDLNEAEQRSGRADWSIPALRQHWSLPSKAKKAAPEPEPSLTPTVTPSPTPGLNK
jgi:hypothetical protein